MHSIILRIEAISVNFVIFYIIKKVNYFFCCNKKNNDGENISILDKFDEE